MVSILMFIRKYGLLWVLAVFTGLYGGSPPSALTINDIGELLRDMRLHNSFEYINATTLPESWFRSAYDTMDDPALYIIFSDTKSPASKVISLFTGEQFNHVSLAFDKDLETLVSYNGGNGMYNPGLNPEAIEAFSWKDASFAVYRLAAQPEQKRIIIGQIGRINREGSAYNLLGLVTKHSYQPNIMFCSQFVYTMLDKAGLDYFEMESPQVKPVDFIDMDRTSSLQFIRKD
jgi:hypothetical protein